MDEHATIAFSPKRDDVPGSFNMVEIRTGGNRLLRRLRDICGEFAHAERVFCDLLRELPAEALWLREVRAHLVAARAEKVLAIVASGDLETADVDWKNTRDGWDRVCGRIDDLLGDTRPGIVMSLCENEDGVDGFLSVER